MTRRCILSRDSKPSKTEKDASYVEIKQTIVKQGDIGHFSRFFLSYQ